MVGTLLITCVILSAIYTFLTSQVCFFPCPSPPPSLCSGYNTVFHVPTHVSSEEQSALGKRNHSSSLLLTALMLTHTYKHMTHIGTRRHASSVCMHRKMHIELQLGDCAYLRPLPIHRSQIFTVELVFICLAFCLQNGKCIDLLIYGNYDIQWWLREHTRKRRQLVASRSILRAIGSTKSACPPGF